jgi:hypothetical protein
VKLFGKAFAKYDAASGEDDRPGRHRGRMYFPAGRAPIKYRQAASPSRLRRASMRSLVMLANRGPSPLSNLPMTKTTGWLTTYLTMMVAALPDAASNAATAAITPCPCRPLRSLVIGRAQQRALSSQKNPGMIRGQLNTVGWRAVLEPQPQREPASHEYNSLTRPPLGWCDVT